MLLLFVFQLYACRELTAEQIDSNLEIIDNLKMVDNCSTQNSKSKRKLKKKKKICADLNSYLSNYYWGF